jgi:uncharacterized protein YbjT (DUF2867 family)
MLEERMYLVTGPTGNIGAELVRTLAEGGEAVRALVRNPATELPDGAIAVIGDLDEPASLRPALAGVTGVFLLPGYRDMPGLLDEARAAGVQRVVLLSGGSAGSGDLTNAVSAYMIRSEEAVRDSGLPATVLRPSGFMSNALRWLPQLQAGDVVRDAFPNVAVAMIDPADIAAVAAVALTSDQHVGQLYRLSGPQPLLPADRVRVLAEVLDRPLTFVGLSDDAARAEMSQAMPAEYVDAFFRFYVDGDLDESAVLPTVREVTGREPRTFEQWARVHADAFR